jgi:hypothetical protein
MMEEIVARSCRNVFATLLLYAISGYFTKGGFLFPYPIYEVLFFILSCFLLIKAIELKINKLFFAYILFFSFLWMINSIFFLQLIFSHQSLDSIIQFLPFADFLFALFYFGFIFIRYRNEFVRFKNLHFLFTFLILTKWIMYLYNF